MYDRTPDYHLVGRECMDDLTTEYSFGLQVMNAIDVLGLFFDRLSIVVCTTRHWQMFGRLVQELNVCTLWKYFDNN